MKIYRLVAVLMLGSLVTAGCGSTQNSRTTHGPVPGAKRALSRISEYGSVDELIKDSQLVVTIRPSGTKRTEILGEVHFTVSTVDVIRVLHGQPDQPELEIRQTGLPGDLIEGGAEILAAGKTYLAFLQPFTFSDNAPTGQWVVVGVGAGLYEVNGDQAVKVDAESPQLPDQIDLDDLSATDTAQPR